MLKSSTTCLPSLCLLAFLMLASLLTTRAEASERAIDVTPVWAGHPVGFALLTHGQRQYIAFYDAKRQMTVGVRSLGSYVWDFVRLPETLGWDSHNFITMVFDDNEQIHLSGNMHAGPMVYFRTTTPGDIHTFEKAPMVGRDEVRCTYPEFRRGPKNEFIFTYRSGYSGNGDQIFNVYDHKTQSWHRLLDKPLTSGEGKMNAYFCSLFRTPDGYYHLAWVWRDNGGCETNHDLSYARSKDQVHWETSAGKPLELPITLKTAEIVDPIPVRGGLINGNVSIGCDSKKRTIVSYQKYDAKGNTQLYNARLEEGRWHSYQTSDWDYRWNFSGGGSIQFEVGFGPARLNKDGKLVQTYRHIKAGAGAWILDEATLKPIGELSKTPPPAPVAQTPDKTPHLEPRSCNDSGMSPDPKVRYVLRWETEPVNRDRAQDTVPPSMLRLIEIRAE